MAEPNKKPEATKTPRKRTVRPGITRVMVNLADEHFARLTKLAEAEEREPGAQLSLLIRRNIEYLIGGEHEHNKSFTA